LLPSPPGLVHRPTWFETTAADELVFGVHDSRAGTLRVYPSLEQLLAVLVPPAQLEAFGDHTYARAMAAVESAISSVGTKVKTAVEKKSPPQQKPASRAPSSAPRSTPVCPPDTIFSSATGKP
jgi:hypothetical protein